jgi:WD40 repeat protein
MSLVREHRSRVMLLGVLALVLSRPGHLGGTLSASAPPPKPDHRRQVDFYGDPLPKGCVARLGTSRLKHHRSVGCVTFSPDGKTVAFGGEDCLHIAEASTGKVVHRLNAAKAWRPFVHVAFAPDGKTLAGLVGVSKFYVVQTWDSRTGRELKRTGNIPYETPVLSPDLRFVAGQKGRSTVGIWDLATGKEVRELQGYDGTELKIAFAADSRTLAVSSSAFVPHKAPRHALHVWTLDGKLLFKRLEENKWFGPVALSPNGETLAWTDSDEQVIKLRNLATGKETAFRDKLPAAETTALSFSPDGRVLAAAQKFDMKSGGERNGDHYVIQLQDVRTGKDITCLKGPRDTVRSLAFSPGGKILAAASDDRNVRVWNLTMGRELLQGHRLAVRSVRFSPDGKTVATGSDDHTVRLWEPATGKETAVLKGHRSRVNSIAFSPRGKKLASGSLDETTRLWDLATGREIQRFGTNEEAWVHCASLAPDGKTIAVACWGLRIYLWNLKTRKAKWRIETATVEPRCLAFSPDGKVLASLAGLQDKETIHLWDAATGKPIRQITADPYVTTDLAFSPDGRLLATASGYEISGFRVGETDVGSIQVWDVGTGKQLFRLQETPAWRNVNALAFSPDGRMLASGSNDGTVRLWEMATRQERARFAGHREAVWSVAFSPNGKLLASGSNDGTALIWNTHAPLGERRPRTKGRLTTLWNDLAGKDARAAYLAINRLIAEPGQAVPLLKARLRPWPNDSKRFARLLADLDSESFRVREEASKALAALGSSVEPGLRKALADRPNLEVHHRLVRLLERCEGRVTSLEELRVLRAIEVLEFIGTREARQILAALALGGPEATVTQEAKTALRRMGSR